MDLVRIDKAEKEEQRAEQYRVIGRRVKDELVEFELDKNGERFWSRDYVLLNKVLRSAVLKYNFSHPFTKVKPQGMYDLIDLSHS